jgi:hypothetical protein
MKEIIKAYIILWRAFLASGDEKPYPHGIFSARLARKKFPYRMSSFRIMKKKIRPVPANNYTNLKFLQL